MPSLLFFCIDFVSTFISFLQSHLAVRPPWPRTGTSLLCTLPLSTNRLAMKTVQATLAAGLALYVATTAADKVPGRPWDNRTIAGCTWWWDNHDKWTCKQVRDEEYHISPEDFHRWNPSITLDCGNWQNHSYCIQVASEEVSTTSTSLVTLVTSTTATTSSLRPTPTGWKSLGCFIHDPRKPVFNESVLEHGSGLTIEKCESACWSGGFDYAGLKGGSDCLCAHYAGILSTKNKSDCDTPCPGNASEACGGSTAVHAFEAQTPLPWERSTSTSSLLTTTSSPLTNTATATSTATSTFTPAPVPGWRSLGCYKEFDPSLLGYMVEVPGGRDNLTRENCCEACAQSAYSYAGVENGKECWCDNWTPGVWNVVGSEEWYVSLLFKSSGLKSDLTNVM